MKLVIGLLVAAMALVVSAPKAHAEAGPGDSGQEVVEVQYMLTALKYVLPVDGSYGPKTTKAVRHWQTANGLLPDGVVGPLTMTSLEAAVAGAPAVRVASMPLTGVPQCDEMMRWATKHGLPYDDFLYLGLRESGCRNGEVSFTGCCYGYWQEFFTSHMRSPGYLPGIRACGIDSLDDIFGDNDRAKDGQACMTAVLYRYHLQHGPYPTWPWRQ